MQTTKIRIMSKKRKVIFSFDKTEILKPP